MKQMLWCVIGSLLISTTQLVSLAIPSLMCLMVPGQDGAQALLQHCTQVQALRICLHALTCAFDDEAADATQAYIQAYIEGPALWVELPREGWPEDGSWNKFRRPCVRMVNALNTTYIHNYDIILRRITCVHPRRTGR